MRSLFFFLRIEKKRMIVIEKINPIRNHYLYAGMYPFFEYPLLVSLKRNVHRMLMSLFRRLCVGFCTTLVLLHKILGFFLCPLKNQEDFNEVCFLWPLSSSSFKGHKLACFLSLVSQKKR